MRGSIYGEPQPVPTEFRNVDGERLEDGRYAAFREEATLSGAVKPENVFTDPVRTFAYGTDASFYRLIPKMVLKVETEREIQSSAQTRQKTPHARHLPRRGHVAVRPGRHGLHPTQVDHIRARTGGGTPLETKGKRSPSSPASSVARSIVY